MTATFAAIVLTAPPPQSTADGTDATVKIDGRESLVRSVDLFLNRENIPQIVAVFTADKLDEAKKRFGGHFGFAGVKVAAGGPGWIAQIAAGIAKLDDGITHVIVHDGARPAVAYTDLEAILEAAEKFDAVALSTPLTSPLIELDEGQQPVGYRGGGEFAFLLTPQVYSRSLLEKHAGDQSLPHASTLRLLPASPLNIRLNGSADAPLLKAMINLLPKPKIKAANSPFDEAQW